jgi:hypothetical protein
MTTYTNTSYVAKNVGTSFSTLVTVAGATTAAITSLVVANTTTSPITTDVYFTRSAVDYYLVKTATIPVGGSLEVMQGNRVVLIAADALKVLSSAATSADVVVSVLNAV